MMRMDEDTSRDEESALFSDVKEADKIMVKKVFGGGVGGGEGDLTMDQESTAGSSSEETESPRSVLLVKGMRKWSTYGKEKNTGSGIGIGIGSGMSSVHSQILRIRYEDSHVGEDISHEAVSLFAKDDHLPSLLLFSRPILPSSPLRGNTIIKTSD